MTRAIIARSALYVRTPQNRTPKSCPLLLLLRKIITFHRVGNDAANRLSAPRWNFGWFTKIRLKLQLRVSIARSRNPFFATFCVFCSKTFLYFLAVFWWNQWRAMTSDRSFRNVLCSVVSMGASRPCLQGGSSFIEEFHRSVWKWDLPFVLLNLKVRVP